MAESSSDPSETVCGRMMVGCGGDTYDPVCELPAGHGGWCKSRSAIGQHRLRQNDPARTAAHAVSSQPNPEPHTTAQGDTGGVGSSSQETALAMWSQARKGKPLHDFERAEPRPRIRMLVCGRCATWATPSTVITSPCLKNGTPHHFEACWYRLDENQGWD